MPALDHTVTTTPTDLLSALSLQTGQTYSIQNVDPRARIFVRIQPTAPGRTDRANVIAPLKFGYPQADVGEGIWVWTDDDGGAAIVVNDG